MKGGDAGVVGETGRPGGVGGGEMGPWQIKAGCRPKASYYRAHLMLRDVWYLPVVAALAAVAAEEEVVGTLEHLWMIGHKNCRTWRPPTDFRCSQSKCCRSRG